jgi:hypothetical protein
MSFLNDLKHLVVEEDPNEQKTETATPAAATPHTTTPTGIPGLAGISGLSSAPAPSAPSPVQFQATAPVTADANLASQMAAKLREKFTASPYNAILSNFASTLTGLAEDIPEEGRRFRAALKLQSNVTVEQLTAAYQSLNEVLESEVGKFQQSVGQLQTKEVTTREQQVQQIDTTIQTKNKEIADLMSQRDQINNDIIAAKQNIGAKVASFEGAVASLKSEVRDSIQKLAIYFPSPAASAAKK